MFVIEQPCPPAPSADSAANVMAEWNTVYNAYNEELKSMFEKQARVKRPTECPWFTLLPQDLTVGLILNGLTKYFVGFVRNYNMHNMGKTIGELHAMLIEYEKGLPKQAETPQVIAIRGCKIQKANNKSLKAKELMLADLTCSSRLNFYTNIVEEKEASWHCQFFRGARKLKQGAIYLYVGNGVRAQVEAIGSFDLVLPNGLCFTDYGISVSKNDVLYLNVIPRDGIYEIDMHNLVPNINSIYNVSNKRAKHNLDSTYLWHCRLAHISKKRIEKLQHEGLLKSTDDESFDKYVSCLSGNMTRKPFRIVPKEQLIFLE
ncbi:retrotransposon protein, putative, ty1-copia subclass [Tanacetum coccineum]